MTLIWSNARIGLMGASSPATELISKSGLPREIQFLLASSRSQMDDELVEAARKWTQPRFNWETLRSEARWHGVLPLVAFNLCRFFKREMPGAELDLLKVVLKGNASHVMVWQHELSCIVEQLGKKNIPYLVLNGVTLGSSACRQFCVNNPSLLDIFVPPIDVPKAIGLLAKLGYQIPVQLNSWQWESLIAFGDRITVNPGSKSFSIQLRWRLAPPRFEWNSWNTLYDRARTVAIEGNIYSTLSLEDSLLFCCAQGAASVWNRLSAIGDLCELLYESDNLDWEYIQSQTSGRYHEFVVLTGVLLAHRIMGAALPCIVNEETRITQGVRTSCVEINKALFRNNKPENPTGFQKIHHLWCLCPDRSSKAEVIRSFLKPALEDVQSARIPFVLRDFYYPIRGCRLAYRALSEWWNYGLY